MSSIDHRSGHCPLCTERIPRDAVLIEYDTDGERRQFAECPACGDVVHPN